MVGVQRVGRRRRLRADLHGSRRLRLSAADADDGPPEPLDAAILFAPVGSLVPTVLRALDRGGRLAIAGIYLSDMPALSYEQELFYERNLVSVTANTRVDGKKLLAVVERIRLQVRVIPYAFTAADRALDDLTADRVTGAAVLQMPQP